MLVIRPDKEMSPRADVKPQTLTRTKPSVKRRLFIMLVFLAPFFLDGSSLAGVGKAKSSVHKYVSPLQQRIADEAARRAGPKIGVNGTDYKDIGEVAKDVFKDFKQGELQRPPIVIHDKADLALELLKGQVRAQDGRFVVPMPVFPPLGSEEAKPIALEFYTRTENALKKHPPVLLKRSTDGRFVEIPPPKIADDQYLLLEQNRHREAIIDVVATGAYDAGINIRYNKSPYINPEGIVIPRGPLSPADLKFAINKLGNDKQRHSIPPQSVASVLGRSAARLDHVSKIIISQDQTNNDLEVELSKLPANQADDYRSRTGLDDIVRYLESEGFYDPAP